jgi:hypothetical protein
MPEETEVVPVEEVVAEPEPSLEPRILPASPKFRRVIQPVDEAGQPLGSPHVYEADTQEDLDEKMATAIAHGTRKIHELSRQITLESPALPQGAIPEEQIPVWKPRDLTEEEKFIVKTDPEKAFDIQHQARYGMSVEDKRKLDEETASNSRVMRAKAETDVFTEDHPDYYGCRENREAMVQYITKNRMAWHHTNLELAFQDLSAKGLLKTRPEPVAAARTEPAPERTKAPVTFPSVIRNNSSSATGPVALKKGPSAEERAFMSAEQLKKLYPELQGAR